MAVSDRVQIVVFGAKLNLALTLGLLVRTVAGQGQVGPAIIGWLPRYFSQAFTDPSYPGVGITEFSLVPHPNGTPGLFLGAGSSSNVPPAFGGNSGRLGIIAFTFDRVTNRIAFNGNAASFNLPGVDVHWMHWSKDGTYAVATAGGGQTLLQAMAATPGGVLGPPVPIANSLGLFGATPGTIGTSQVLFATIRTASTVGVGFVQHDVANGRIGAGVPTLVTSMPFPPTSHDMSDYSPILGADGDIEGLFCFLFDYQNQVKHWLYQGDLNPATVPSYMALPTPVYFGAGSPAEAGGTVYVDANCCSRGLLEFDVVVLLGDTVRSGQGDTIDLTAFSPLRQAGLQDVTLFLAGRAFSSPTTVPGIGNALGLDPQQGLFVLGTAAHSRTWGRGVLSFPVSSLPAGTIPVQGLTLLGDGTVYFTSTAAVTVQ